MPENQLVAAEVRPGWFLWAVNVLVLIVLALIGFIGAQLDSRVSRIGDDIAQMRIDSSARTQQIADLDRDVNRQRDSIKELSKRVDDLGPEQPQQRLEKWLEP